MIPISNLQKFLEKQNYDLIINFPQESYNSPKTAKSANIVKKLLSKPST